MSSRVRVHTRGSTHGYDTNPDQHWSHAATCAQSDPDAWFIPSAPDWAAVGRSIHICRRHCPVQEACYREMAGIKSAIVGGYYFNDRGTLSDFQPDPGTCMECRRAA